MDSETQEQWEWERGGHSYNLAVATVVLNGGLNVGHGWFVRKLHSGLFQHGQPDSYGVRYQTKSD